MAGGAYKGLTIRIGADTTKLSSALRGVNSAIYKTQTELRKLSQAAKLDPGNRNVANAQIGAVANQAVDAAAKLDTLKRAISEVSEQKATSQNTTIGELAKQTENAALSVEQAKSRYEELTGELDRYYSIIKELSGVNLHEETENGTFDAAIDKLVEVGTLTTEDALHIYDLKDAWNNAFDSYADAQAVAGLERVKNEAVATEAQMNSLGRAFIDLKPNSNVSTLFGGIDSKIALVSAAAETAGDRLSRLDEAAKLDPTNFNTAKERIDAIADAIEVAEYQASLFREKISGYHDLGFDEVNNGINNIPLELERSKEAAASAHTEVSRLKGELANATEAAFRLVDEGKTGGAYADTFGEAANKVDELTNALAKAEEAESRAMEDFDTAQTYAELEQAKTSAAEFAARAESLRNILGQIRMPSALSSTLKEQDANLNRMSAAASTATDRFNRLNEASKLNPYNFEIAGQKARAFSEAIAAAQAKAAALQEKINAYKAEGIDEIARNMGDVAVETERADQRVEELRRELAEASNSPKATTEEVKKLKTALAEAERAADTAHACSELKELETQAAETRGAIATLRGSMKADFGEIGSAAVIAAQQVGQFASQIGRNVIESSDEVDKSYRNLRKTFDASEEQYKELYDAAMEFGSANVTSASAVLEMESIAAQLGVGLGEDGKAAENATEQIKKFAEVAANLDVATNIDSETIALQMGQISNVMGDLSSDNIDAFGDALVRLGNTMPTQESNIMQITQRLSAVGDVAGFTTPELMGWAAAIASTGQKSEAAATGISTIITRISAAVSEGGDELKKFSKVAGVSSEEFVKRWRTNASDALRDVIEGVKESGDDMFATLSGMDVASVRQTQTLASLANTLDNVDKAIGFAKDAWDGGGDAAAEAAKKAEGFSGTLAKLKNSAQVLGATFGEAMVPWMKRGLDIIQRLTDWLNSFDTETRGTIVVVGGLATAFSAAWPIISAFGSSIGGLIKGGAGLAVKGMAELGAEAQRLGEAVKLASGGAGTWMEALQATGTFAGNTATKIESLVTSFTNLLTSGNLFAGIFGSLALVTIADYVRQISESAAETQRFDSVIEDMSGTLDGLSASLWTGKESASKFSDGWSGASSGINDLITSLEEHNRVNKETRDEAVTTIGELQRYGDIVAEAAGKGDEFAGSELELKTAIEGLNEILGTNYTVADVLGGVYLDQAGAVENLAEKIDQLVEAKKREVRLSAMEDIYKEDFQAYAEAENAYDKAIDAREKFLEKWKSENMGRTEVDSNKNLVTIDESNWESYARRTEGYRDLTQAITETRDALNETGKAMEVTEKQWQGYADEMSYLTTNNFGVRESIMMFNEDITKSIMETTDWGDKLQDIQPEVGELAQKLQEAKVGASEFADFASNNPDLFAEMLKDANGDIDTLADSLAKYFDEAREDNLEWNGNDWKPVKLEVENYATEALNLASEELRQAIADTDLSVGDLMAGLDNAGVSAEKFASLTSEQFNQLYLDAGGDVEQLIQLIANLGESEPIELDAKANTDGVKEDVDTAKAGAESDTIEIPADANTAPAEESTEELRDNVESKPVTQTVELKTETPQDATSTTEEQTATVKVTVDDADAAAKLDELAKDRTVNLSVATDEESMQAAADAISSTMSGASATSPSKVNVVVDSHQLGSLSDQLNRLTSRAYRVSVVANVDGGGKKQVNDIHSTLKQVAKGWNAKLNVSVVGVPAVNGILQTLRDVNGKHYHTYYDIHETKYKSTVGSNARGGYMPDRIPRHADGFIATRATLTDYGWIGEDGAEAYSGGSLVPLTNRKYSMPYINDISDAVAKKIGPVSAGNQITVTVTGVSGPDEVADAIARRLSMLNL